MKALVWHSDSHHPLVQNVHDVYKRLFVGLKRNLDKHGVGLVHLTTRGHEKYSDEWVEYDLDPRNVVLNREIVFAEFLKTAPHEYYWLTEPDCRMTGEWPAFTTDCLMIRRFNDGVPLCPAWRVATPKAQPLFQEICEMTKQTPPRMWGWHGDSESWTQMYKKLGKPDIGFGEYQGITIEYRHYNDHILRRGKYSENWKAGHKMDLLIHDGI